MNNKYDELLEYFSDENIGELRAALREIERFVALLGFEAGSYGGTGRELMSSIYSILRACQSLNPSIQLLSDDFRSSWESYVYAERVSLDEAFGISRPKNFDHQATKFKIQKSLEVYTMVQSLRDSGVKVNDACRTVANEYPRGESTIKAMYYDHKKLIDGMRSYYDHERGIGKFFLA